ncbi:hypothetical protein V6N13_039991 [Hibiscus sabdariffa]
MGQCHSRASSSTEEEEEVHCEEEEEEEETSSMKKGCLTMAKEQRSRFYILRRCVIMLLCWQKYGKH